MADPGRHPGTHRQAEDLYFENLRRLHPDAKLSAAIDRYVRGRPGGADAESRGQGHGPADGTAKLQDPAPWISDDPPAAGPRTPENP